MRHAAGDLDFEEAARLRDEIKRLRQTELAVVDDPTARSHAPTFHTKGAGGPPKPLAKAGVESVPTSSTSPRSKLGRAGMHGGWKGKKR